MRKCGAVHIYQGGGELNGGGGGRLNVETMCSMITVGMLPEEAAKGVLSLVALNLSRYMDSSRPRDGGEQT